MNRPSVTPLEKAHRSFSSQSEAGGKKDLARTKQDFLPEAGPCTPTTSEIPTSTYITKPKDFSNVIRGRNPLIGITVDIQFCKKRELIFISHLDVMRLFLRTFRRAGIPLLYTQGFNPRPKMRFERALPLGVKGRKEKMTIFLTKRLELKKVKKDINKLLPKGIQIIKMAYRTER